MIATFAIPCRNAGSHLRPLLESLLAQTRQDFEILLVDDASEDDSVELARAVAGPRIALHRNERPLGIGANWNRAAALVRTPLFCLAHQDDVYRPEYLAVMTAALAAKPEAAAAHCRAFTLDEGGREFVSASERYKDRFWKRGGFHDHAALYASLLAGNWIIAPSVLFRTAAVRELGGFAERLRFVLDWEYWLRMLRSGHGLIGVAKRLVGYRRHAASATAVEERSLNRYREEHEIGEQARELGSACGLLPATAKPSVAMRNDVLRDALFDLRRGDHAACAAKLHFATQLAPWCARDPLFASFGLLSRAGAPGRWLLSAGFRLLAGPPTP